MTSKKIPERNTETSSVEQRLFMAIFKADYDAVEYLLDRGANLNALSPAGHTPLGTAAERGLTDIVKLLLNYNPLHQNYSDVRDTAGGICRPTCTGSAAVQDAVEPTVAKENRGYFIMVHNEEGEPDIAGKEEKDAIETGRSFDENFNEAVTPDDMDKLEWDFEEIENDIDDKGAWYMMYQYLGCTSAHLNESRKCSVNQVDAYGRTAVHYAASEGQLETLTVLMKAGASVDVRDKENITPLHLAAERNHPAVVSLLLSTVPWNYSTDLTRALHSAAFRGCTPVVDILLNAKVDINAEDEYGQTPLWLATCGNQYSVLDLLLRRGAKVNIEDQQGRTPLSWAVKMRHDELAKRLLEAGARLTQSDLLLHSAVLSRQPELARQLLKAGAMANIRDDNGDTPLILASRIGHIELAEILIQGGANANYPNSVSGVTPLHVAVECLRESQFTVFRDLVHILRQAGARLDFESSTTGDTPLIRALIFEKIKFAALLVTLGANVNQAALFPCRIDISTLLRRSGHVPLVQLFVSAGLRPKSCEEEAGSSAEKKRVDAWLKNAAANPMSLAGQCRIVIRNRFKDRINEVVATSKLPKALKKFLMFADIDSFDIE